MAERVVRGDEERAPDLQVNDPRLGDLEDELAALGQFPTSDLLGDHVPGRSQSRVEEEQEGRPAGEEGLGVDGVPKGERRRRGRTLVLFLRDHLERQRHAAEREEVGGVPAQVQEGPLGGLRGGAAGLARSLGGGGDPAPGPAEREGREVSLRRAGGGGGGGGGRVIQANAVN